MLYCCELSPYMYNWICTVEFVWSYLDQYVIGVQEKIVLSFLHYENKLNNTVMLYKMKTFMSP